MHGRRRDRISKAMTLRCLPLLDRRDPTTQLQTAMLFLSQHRRAE
jgi:hypothetical protein